MFRLAFAITTWTLLACPVAAEGKKDPKKATVELGGDIADEALQKLAPANGVVASEKSWETLAKAWGIKDAPKVDFTKELLIVGTTRGSSFGILPVVKDGDLTISTRGTKDIQPGFRWKILSISREGIKTVQGKELPRE